MRLVKHSNPDAMPHCWPPPPDDGTAWREDGTKDGDGIAGLAIIAAVLLVFCIGLSILATTLWEIAATGGGK